jgi:hypothetical protein
MSNVDDVSGLGQFKYLTSVRLMKLLRLRRLVGVGSSVERLWCTECGLEEVSGLDDCVNLCALYLSSNRLPGFGAGLRSLRNLTTLWACENAIDHIGGLEALGQLRCPALEPTPTAASVLG